MERVVTVAKRPIRILQDPAKASTETAFSVWDASILLAKYLGTPDFAPDFWKGKRVIELGAGCGLCGLAAASLGASVTLTDQDFVVPQLQFNANANKEVAANVTVAGLSWGASVSALKPPFDVVLLADLLYVDALSEALCATIGALCNSQTLVIFCNERRDVRLEDRFLVLMREQFDQFPVSLDRLHHKWRDPAIRVIQMRKKLVISGESMH